MTSDRDLAIIAKLADAIRAIEPTAVILVPDPKPAEPAPAEETPTPEKPKPDVGPLLKAAIERLQALARRCFNVIDATKMPDGTPLPQSYYQTTPDDARDWIGELENELAEQFRIAANAGNQYILADPAQPIQFAQLPNGDVQLSAAFALMKTDPRSQPAEPAEETKP